MLGLYRMSKHKLGQQLIKHSKLQEGELMLLAAAWNDRTGRNYSQRTLRHTLAVINTVRGTFCFKCGRAKHIVDYTIQRRV